MTSREAFHAYIVAETGRTPERWRSKGIVPEGIDPDAYVMGSDQREWRAWQASRKQAMEEAEKAHAVERLELHLLRDRFESQQRLTNSALATLAEKRTYMDVLDARDARWPIKRAVGLRLQAVPVYQRQSYDVLWDASCRGVDDAIRSLTPTGEKA
jgi:hypothetical protein